MISSIAAAQLLFCTGHQRQPFMVKRLQRQRKEDVTHLDSVFMWYMKETTPALTQPDLQMLSQSVVRNLQFPVSYWCKPS